MRLSIVATLHIASMWCSTHLLLPVLLGTVQWSGCNANLFRVATAFRKNIGIASRCHTKPEIGSGGCNDVDLLSINQMGALDTILVIPRGGGSSASLLVKIMKVHRFLVLFFGLQTVINPNLSTLGMTSYSMSRAEIFLVRMWGCFITFVAYVIHLGAGWEHGSFARLQIAKGLFGMYTTLTIINAMEIFNESVVENKQVNIIYLFIFATFAAAYGIGVIYAS